MATVNKVVEGMKESKFKKYIKSIRYTTNSRHQLDKIIIVLHRHVGYKVYEELEVVIGTLITINNHSLNVDKIKNKELIGHTLELRLMLKDLMK